MRGLGSGGVPVASSAGRLKSMNVESNTVKRRSSQTALKWAFVMSWGHRGASSLLTLVLAAILGPTAFGVVAMAIVYIAFIETLLEQGLTAALIQRKDLQEEHLDSAFWMVLAAGSALTGISLALSGWWASVNSLPELAPVINTLSLLIVIQCLTIVQQAVLQREMDFRSLAVRANVSVLIGGAVGIAMALYGLGIWALVGQKVTEAVAALFLLWSLSHWRPTFRFSSRHVKDLLGFSSATFLAKLSVVAGRSTDALVIGMLLGPTAVGLYRFAGRILEVLLELGTRPMQVVALPQYSRVQDDPPELRRSVLASIRASSVLTIPGVVLLATLSDPLLAVIGAEWAAAADVLKLLCIIGLIHTFTVFSGPLLQAVRRPYTFTGIVWGFSFVNLAAVLCAAVALRDAPLTEQITGVAAARAVVAAVFNIPISLFVFRRLCRITIRDLVVAVMPSALSAIVVGAVAQGVCVAAPLLEFGPRSTLAAGAVLAVSAGAATLLYLDRRLGQVATDFMHELLGKARAARRGGLHRQRPTTRQRDAHWTKQ